MITNTLQGHILLNTLGCINSAANRQHIVKKMLVCNRAEDMMFLNYDAAI